VDYASEPLAAGTAIDYEGVGTMSKSKNNGVDPQDLIDRYGADTARLYMMFTAPPEATLEWNDGAVEGSYRFLKRVWAFAQKHQAAIAQTMQAGCGQTVNYTSNGKALRYDMYSAFKQANYDYERMQYNTVVSAAMKMLNTLEAAKLTDSYDDRAVLTECTSLLVAVLYPACPHLGSALWNELGYAAAMGDILDAPWPKIDEAALQKDEIELMLQVGGKLRGSILVPASASKEQIEAAALASEPVQKATGGNAPKKIIVVPGRLVNIVV
jgi:leucyl-tRNA synthetase